jgi:hypothetical protein
MMDIKYLDLTEFREGGYLQEVNRRFFHLLGLALSVNVDDETGKVLTLGNIWDFRDDPEGLAFSEEEISLDMVAKARKINREMLTKMGARIRLLGDFVQPLEVDLD